MIEVKISKDEDDCCLACGSRNDLFEVGIRRSINVNKSCNVLCAQCIHEMDSQTIKIQTMLKLSSLRGWKEVKKPRRVRK